MSRLDHVSTQGYEHPIVVWSLLELVRFRRNQARRERKHPTDASSSILIRWLPGNLDCGRKAEIQFNAKDLT
jgi:hypothetical protein